MPKLFPWERYEIRASLLKRHQAVRMAVWSGHRDPLGTNVRIRRPAMKTGTRFPGP